MATPLVAVLDADVLVPILSCDLLLSCFDHDLYQPVVTRRILDEVERTLATDFAHLDRDALTRRLGRVAEVLVFHTHPEAPASGAIAGVNAKDRHVAAIALATHAAVVVTNDKRLRRQINALAAPLQAITGDEFMVSLYYAQPNQVDAALDTMVARRTRRPISRGNLLDALAPSFPRFAAEASP